MYVNWITTYTRQGRVGSAVRIPEIEWTETTKAVKGKNSKVKKN